MKTIHFIYLLLISLLFFTNCQKNNSGNIPRTEIISANWKLQRSDKLNGIGGDIISQKSFEPDNWYNAVVPGTIMGSLVADNIVKNPYFGLNLKAVDKAQFKEPWWYRTSFKLSANDIRNSVSLRFRGINYRADLWVNGKKVVGKDKFAGAFNMFTFKINDYALEGENTVALKIWQPVNGNYSIGFVDWNPLPPDKSMGVFRDVVLEVNGGVKIRSPFVHAKVDKENLNAADLTIQAELENNTDKTISGLVKIDFEHGLLEKKVKLGAGETLTCSFLPEEYEQLKVRNVKLWWPNGLGKAHLYNLKIEFISDNKLVDEIRDKYGIREIDSYLDKNKNRVFTVNGKFILLKGGGWVDDLLLQDTKESIEAQIKYVNHMKLNSIRLEGFWGKDETLYDLCDEYGILIMVGWSCHWEWDEYLGKPTHSKYMAYNNKEDINLLAGYWKNQLLWLRNHPSIYVWMVGSDKLPDPELEKKYVELFDKYDTSRVYVTSAGGVGSDQGIVGDEVLFSEISGPTGMKMLGPYAYTPPQYWYMNTNLGGAYGFNTETCPGPNISPLASLKKMLPSDRLWPIDKEYWEFHCGRNAFQTLDRYMVAINARYGKSASVEEFAFKSQLMNYELMRPMFEAFIAHKPQSTGLVQWMLNSAWPEMYWQLYDSYLQPNAAFYAVRKANNAVHAIYRYGKNDIYIANNSLIDALNLRVSIKLYNIHSEEIFAKEWKGGIAGNISKEIVKLPKYKKLTNVYFLSIKVYNEKNIEIDNSFYWLSTKPDVLDYEAADTLAWPYYTPSKGYADYSELNKLSDVKLTYDYEIKQDNDSFNVDLTIKNPSNSIAFFIYFDIIDSRNGKPILPVFWDDNYVSLLPGEEQVFHAYFSKNNVTGNPEIKIKAWNVAPVTLNSL